MGGYVKKTDRRRYEDRSFSVRAVHRDPADLHKLAEVLIRLTLQEPAAAAPTAAPPNHLRPTATQPQPSAQRRVSQARSSSAPASLAYAGCCGPKPHPHGWATRTVTRSGLVLQPYRWLLSRSTLLPGVWEREGRIAARGEDPMTTTTTAATDPAASLIDPPISTAVAISYLRVSTREQASKGRPLTNFSIPAQRDAVRRKADQLGAAIVEEFVDAGASAKSADRPDLMRMIQYVKTNKVAYCIVHKVDRLARNRADDVTIHLALQRGRGHARLGDGEHRRDPSGMLLHGIMSTIAGVLLPQPRRRGHQGHDPEGHQRWHPRQGADRLPQRPHPRRPRPRGPHRRTRPRASAPD